MSEKPILFCTEMVKAILEDRKTMTRRVITKISGIGPITDFGESTTPGYRWHFRDKHLRWYDVNNVLSPYKTGDILWVRETWRVMAVSDHCVIFEYKTGNGLIYETTDMVFLVKMAGKARWQPSIFMPRVAARLFPEVKSVRIERLQDITEEDAKAEGAEKWGWFRPHGASDEDCITYGKGLWPCYKNGFAHIWEKINSENYPWNSNPWVWVIEFGRIEK